jgi:hypothetical protein
MKAKKPKRVSNKTELITLLEEKNRRLRLRLRSGTKFVVEAGIPSLWLIPFNMSKTEPYVLEVGEGYLRFHSLPGMDYVKADAFISVRFKDDFKRMYSEYLKKPKKD